MKPARSTLAICAVALSALLPSPARADAIDGDWCRADGKRMAIHGPDITTPGGKQTRGEYTRHSFSYVIPNGEAGAGETVQIILRNEFLAHARQGSSDAPMQEWKRCSATVS